MKAIRTHVGVAVLLVAAAATAAPLVAQDKKVDQGDKKPAVLTVKVVDDAKVIIDGEQSQEMGGSGTERSYNTPPLPVGKKYYYVVKSFREPNNYTKITRSRKVYVRAGEDVTIDLTGPDDPKQPDEIRIRYVPTPMTVADKMLEMAKVGKDDVVFDLGCGDGRIVIRAVEKFGAARGVGVDFDPERIKDSEKNLKKSTVGDKVKFREGDALKVPDLSEATVICLYLGDDLMNQLYPIFKEKLKPGTRIVSHRFKWDEKKWKAEKAIVFTTESPWRPGEDEDFNLLMWTIPGKGEVKKEEKKKEEKKKDDEKKDDEKEEKKKDDKKEEKKKDDKKEDKKDDKKDKDDVKKVDKKEEKKKEEKKEEKKKDDDD